MINENCININTTIAQHLWYGSTSMRDGVSMGFWWGFNGVLMGLTD